MSSKPCRASLYLSLTHCLLLLPAALILAPAMARAQAAQFSYAVANWGGGFNLPFGVALDSSGNVYVADANNNAVKEIPAGCASSACVKTLGGTFSFNAPEGVAVDSGGDVFVANFGNSSVDEIPAGCSSAGCVASLGGGFLGPTSIAVDSAGNLYVADESSNAVTEIPNGCTAASYASSPCTVAMGGGFSQPSGVAVDGSGNLYVADSSNNAVKEIPAGCTAVAYNASSCTTTALGGFFNFPFGIALDSSGNVFVAEFGNNLVKEIPASCIAGSNNSSCVTTLGGSFQKPGGLAVDGNHDVYVAVSGSNAVTELMLNAVDFSSTQVGSSSTIPLTFTFTSAGTIDAPTVLTQGAPNLDFTDAGSGTCTTQAPSHTYSSGDTCTVDVKFGPLFAGPRNGAVVLENSSGTPIATTYAYGNGVAPQVTFSPFTIDALVGGFNQPAGVAVDGHGNAYVAVPSPAAVDEIPAGCSSSACVIPLGGGFSKPQGVAVDGAGNVYMVDSGNATVQEIPAGCTATAYASNPCTVGLGGVASSPGGIAIDGAGNLYVTVSNNPVEEISAGCTATHGLSCVQTSLGGGFGNAAGIAVDAGGNVFVADSSNNAVKEMSPGCASSACVTSLGGGFSNPGGVAVDAGGNVYVADSLGSAIKEMPAACASAACVTTLTGAFPDPAGLALDGSGNLFLVDAFANQAYEIQRVTAPSLTFAAAAIGQTSIDSPQTVTVQNIGNATLTFASQSYPADFPEASGVNTDCMLFTSLASANSCTLSIDFSPVSSLNGASSASLGELVSLSYNLTDGTTITQSVPVSGTETSYVSVSVGTSPAGLAFSVDSSSYTSNQSLQWTPGVSHTLSTTSPQTTLGATYTFSFWSDGTGTTASTTDNVLPTATAAYTAVFTASSYELIVTPNNASYGTVTAPSGSGYYSPGATVTLTAVPAIGYYFTGWTGSSDVASPSSASTTVTMNGPENIAANFAAIPNFVVNVATDNDNGNAAKCTAQSSTTTNSTDANCELRDALAAAASAGAGNIYFDSSKFPSATAIPETNATMAIPPNTSIYGLASPAITVQGNGSASVFSVASGVSASISNLTITSVAGSGPSNGGGIFDDGGNISLSHSTITGNAASNNGGGIYASGGTLTLSNSTITNNTGSTLGGGIYIAGGSLTIDSSTIANNNPSYSGTGGGGLYVDGGATVNIARSTLSGNESGGFGGAINVASGSVTISNGSTVSGNSTNGGGGGGIASYDTLIVNDSTISANRAGLLGGPGSGGGIDVASGSATIAFSTLSGNSAGLLGGGLLINSGAVTLINDTISANAAANGLANPTGGGIVVGSCTSCRMFNTIASGNTDSAGYPDDDGPWDSSSANNLIGNDGGSSGLTNGTNGNIVGSQPMLSTLGNYGGPTEIMVPLPASPAICAGSSSKVPNGTTTDQRGVTIGAGGYCPSGAVDIGAVQTDYSIKFTTEPPATGTTAGTAMSPAPQVTVSENGLAGLVPIDPANVNVTDAGSNLATTPATAGTAAGVATFSSLIFTSAATGDTLTATLASPNISATSTAFDVAAASTTISVSSSSVAYSGSSQTVALSATVNSGGAGVNGGTVTFAVFNGASQIGSSATSNTASGGNASAVFVLPAGTAPGTYSIHATYNPSAAYAGSSETTATLIVSQASTTTAASSVTGTFGSAVTLSATVTSPAGVVNEGSITFNFGDGSANAIASVSNGSASVMHTYSATGVYTIVAVYSDNPSSGYFLTSSDSAHTITINQAIPTVTAWPTASGIAYGQTLANSTLTGGSASVPGAFAWTNSTTVPLAGTSSQSVTFTPTSANYAPVTGAVPVSVTAPDYVVNDKNDDNGTGVCTPLTSTTSNGKDSACSLRDALAAAANAGGGKIYFDATVFASAVTIAETNGTLVIPANTDIFGLSTNTVTVQGNAGAPVFSLASGLTGLISHLTITGGGGASGGGIQNNGGTLTLSNSTITANSATIGGGIYLSGGVVTLKNSTLTGNQSTGGNGGGIDVAGGSVNITGSNIGGSAANAGNMASALGGGIAMETGAGTVTIANTTFTANTAQSNGGAIWLNGGTLNVNGSTFAANSGAGGGGIYVQAGSAGISYSTFNLNSTTLSGGGAIYNSSSGTVTIANGTISNNAANAPGGGGIDNDGGTVTLNNTIVAGNNESTSPDFFGAAAGNNNLIGAGLGMTGIADGSNGNIFAGALLGPLANNGGATQTMVPQPGSPAICAGSPSYTPTGAVTDQRGTGFPNTNTVYPTYPGYSGASTPCVDMGAVQTAYALSFSTEPPSSVDTDVAMSPAPVVSLNGSATLAVTITDADSVLTGTTTVNMSGSSATFGSLVLGSNIAGDTLTAALPLNANVTLTATSTPVTSTQVPATISTYQGSSQSVLIGSPFASDLQAQVLDGGGVPVPGAFVTFTAPGAGAGGTFSNGTGTITVATGANGIADSGPFTANNNAGSYDVSASVSSLSVDFSLTNTPGAFSGLSLSFPSYFDNAPNAFTGWPIYVIVEAVDAHGNIISTNNDTIQVTSTDTQAVLPANFTLNQGWSAFQLTPNTVNASTAITATDLSNPASANIAISVAATPNIVVNTKADSNDSITNCTTSPEGACSLRDALTAAYAAGAANITFDSTAVPSGSTLTLDSTLGSMDIPNDTRITGPHTGSGLTLSDGITLSGGGQTSVFTMGDPNAQGIIDGLAITGGTIIDLTGYPVSGAAIFNDGTLTVMHSVISNNLAFAYGPVFGGAIYSDNDLEISDSTIADNSASSFLVEGAGIDNDSYLNLANVTISGNKADAVTAGGAAGGAGLFTSCADISDSSISGNSALGPPDGSGTAAGGGIFAEACITITNTTISGNSAAAGGTATGGGIYDYYGDVHAYSLTISANSSDDGGGLNNAGGAAMLANSIVAANVAPVDADIDGALDPASSYNLIGDGTGLTGIANGANGNQVGASPSPIGPGLGLLAANGGPTQTMLPQPGSPAICAGASSLIPTGVTTDQRGVKIAVGGYCPSGDVDIGAVQTDYSLSFSQQPGDANVNKALAPAPAVLVTEGGIPFAGGSVVLSVAAGTLTGTSTQVTDAGGVATFSGISISPVETGDTLTATLSPSPAIAINSNSFDVQNPVIPSLTSPSASSPLAGHITFTWSPGNVGASLYALWIGTTGVGSHDLYGSPQLAGTVTSQSVYIPLNGAKLYVRLWYVVSGAFDHVDYTTFSEAQPPALTSPSASSPLAGHTTFTWNPGTGAPSIFALWIGTTGVGSHDLYGSPQFAGSVTSQTVNIPLNGARLYVRLWYVVNGAWDFIDYTAFNEAQAPALTSPSGSSLLAGKTTFTWSSGTGAPSIFELSIGTTAAGSHDVYDSGLVAGTVTSETVNIPLNGARLYVRLWYVVNGAFDYIDYSAFNEAQAPALTSPSASSPLGGHTTFAWSSGTGTPSTYALWIGTTGTGSHDLYGSPQVANTVTSETVNIPLNGVQLYVRLWYVVNGAWDYTDYTTFSEAQAPALTAPSASSPLAGATRFTWSSGTGTPSLYALWVGTAGTGSHDVYGSPQLANTVTSETANIPQNGATLYVRLWYVVSGAWDYTDYTTFSEKAP